MTIPRLIPPFHGTAAISQAYAHLWPGVEPFGYLYPDHSIAYVASRGATGGCYHNGIDYGLDAGTPLYAADNGVVTFAGWDTTGFGQCIKVNHPGAGVTTLVGHLSATGVRVGESVERGQQIGRVGATGNATGPHLHFSVIRMADGHYVDPAPYVLAADPAPLPSPSPKPTPAPTPKPSVPAQVHFVTFTGIVMDGGAVLYDGPHSRMVKMSDLVAGTALAFDAWMRGEALVDPTTKALDDRWLHQTQSGWVASARVEGSPPNSKPMP